MGFWGLGQGLSQYLTYCQGNIRRVAFPTARDDYGEIALGYTCLYAYMYAYNWQEVANRMPNKTIYIKDADVKIWDEAQKQLGGESISSIIVDCLKGRLRASKTIDNVEAIKEVLSDVNEEQSLDLELHPFWSPIILDANTLDVGYKLHEKRATPDRIMSLIVDPFNFDTDGRFTSTASEQIKLAILEFWDGKQTDHHVVVRIGNLDILSRLLNLIGKQGLVKIAQAGEIGFTILAVHPAPDLPARGDDDELQRAITRSDFTVQFDEGTVVDGSNRKIISGQYISLIRGRY
jgi:hypothetical protein